MIQNIEIILKRSYQKAYKSLIEWGFERSEARRLSRNLVKDVYKEEIAHLRAKNG